MKLSKRDRVRPLDLAEGTAGWLAGAVVLVARPDPQDPLPTWVAAIAATTVACLGMQGLLEHRVWPPRREKRRPLAALVGGITAVALIALIASLHLLIGDGPRPTPDEWLHNTLVGWVGCYVIILAMALVPPDEDEAPRSRQTEITDDLPSFTATWRVGSRR